MGLQKMEEGNEAMVEKAVLEQGESAEHHIEEDEGEEGDEIEGDTATTSAKPKKRKKKKNKKKTAGDAAGIHQPSAQSKARREDDGSCTIPITQQYPDKVYPRGEHLMYYF